MTRAEFNEALNEVEKVFLATENQPGIGIMHYESKISATTYSGALLKANAGTYFANWEAIRKAVELGLFGMVKPFHSKMADTTFETIEGGIYEDDIVLDIYGFYDKEA